MFRDKRSAGVEVADNVTLAVILANTIICLAKALLTVC